MELNVWKLHPKTIRVVRAEKTLNDTANPVATKWCRPYSSANAIGWWLFPPINIDIVWLGGKNFEHRMLEPWSNTDHELVQSLSSDSVDNICPPSGRTKFTWGAVEEGVAQIWTGCIFQTPPGWCLQIRSPINSPNPDYHVMEGILETDWMWYDIWINLNFHTKNKVIEIRKDQWPPLAQLIPVRRETVDGDWKHKEEIVNRQSPEANQVIDYWLNYNKKKFASGGKQNFTEDRNKDSTTFFQERKRLLPKDSFEAVIEPPKPINDKTIRPKLVPNVHSSCPYSTSSERASFSLPECDPSSLGKNRSPYDHESGDV